MRLADLLSAPRISIQCHDNPDADTIASGYALWRYFSAKGKEVRLFYGGANPISKPSLCMLVEELGIPIRHEPELKKVAGLLITVDCQYGGGNLQAVEADSIAVIDHHIESQPLPDLHVLRSSLASCATLVWHMLCAEKFALDTSIATALLYGLYCDSNGMDEIGHILDRALRDIEDTDASLLRKLKYANLSLDDIHKASVALNALYYNKKGRFVVIPVPPCDPNLLGFISDLVMQVDGVDMAVVYFETPAEIKFSVRTGTRDIKASDLALWFTQDGLGSGGGHSEKAGGRLARAKYDKKGLPEPTIFFHQALVHHIEAYTVIDCLTDAAQNRTGFASYTKLPEECGFVPCMPLFAGKETLTVRTLEGDIDVNVRDGHVLMIGIDGEVYPCSQESFTKNYTALDRPYAFTWEFSPTVRDKETGKVTVLTEHAVTCVSKESQKLAIQLTHGIKLFTAWDQKSYMKGEVGDWLVCAPDNPKDLYVVTQTMWPKLYRPTEGHWLFTNPHVQHLPGSVAAAKKAIAVHAQFLTPDKKIDGFQGTTDCHCGNVLITDTQGECWPVEQSSFIVDYTPVAPLIMGQDGVYTHRSGEIWAFQVHNTFSVAKHANKPSETLTGKSGDWLVQYDTDHYGVVRQDVFAASYDILPHTP